MGAVNSTTISGRLVNKSYFEAKRAELEVKALFVKVHKSINDVTKSGSDVGGLNVSALDTLDSYYSSFTAYTEGDSDRAGQVAVQNKQRAMTIAERASRVLIRDFQLGHEGTVYQDLVDRLCDRGLVTELLLAPFASLREYQAILSLRYSRRRD